MTAKSWEGADDWWLGLNRRSGATGAFPASFVEVAETEAPPEQDLVKALDDFDGEGDDELSLRSGDVIEVFEREFEGDSECVFSAFSSVLFSLLLQGAPQRARAWLTSPTPPPSPSLPRCASHPLSL